MSYDAHTPHHEAVGFAGMEVEELEGMILAARNRAEEVLRVIANAVGANPNTESGQNAMAFIAGVKERLEELVGVCESAKAELNRYSSGF